jgi:predicted GIY-YIG superfamily endonuclease
MENAFFTGNFHKAIAARAAMGFNDIMAERQLHLLEPGKPLLQRFGAEFFRAVPRKPGVYVMSGEGERILYVGQSKNLRARLGSYKNARPDRGPRKIIRLVHAVRTITWEECESAEAARLKENQMLRVLRPKFNVVNTYPQAYRFLGLNRKDAGMEFWMGDAPDFHGKIFGAFKSGCVRAYASLLRTTWAALCLPVSPHDFPSPLLAAKPPRSYFLRLDTNPRLAMDRLAEAIENFCAGTSNELIDLLGGAVPQDENISAFQRNLHAGDLEVLTGFFERGPQRNRNICRDYALPEPIIPQDELDDLLVLSHRRKPEQDPPDGTASP